jgi:hypothetical protein
MLMEMSCTPKLQRRWYQYSLRTLLVFVTLCAIPCSWLGVKLKQASREREVAAAFLKLGGEVESSKSSRQGFLETFFSGYPIEHVQGVSLTFCNRIVDDESIADLQQLNWLDDLCLNATLVSDKGLKCVRRLCRLKALQLDNTRTTDSGLDNLKGLSKLVFLTLSNTEITDAGLEKLEGLKELKELQVLSTKVTPGGLEKLRKALPNCDICW